MRRKAYFAHCLDLAKSDPRWVRWTISDWNQKTEVDRKTTGLRPIHIALIKLAMRRVGNPV